MTNTNTIKTKLLEQYQCIYLEKEIDMGECADIQQARIGLLKKSSVSYKIDWDAIGKYCSECDYCQW